MALGTCKLTQLTEDEIEGNFWAFCGIFLRVGSRRDIYKSRPAGGGILGVLDVQHRFEVLELIKAASLLVGSDVQ